MNAKFQAWDEHGINAIGGGPIHSQIHLQLGEPGWRQDACNGLTMMPLPGEPRFGLGFDWEGTRLFVACLESLLT